MSWGLFDWHLILDIPESCNIQALIRGIGVNLIPVHLRHSYDSIIQILDIISKLRQFDQEPYQSYGIILTALIRHAQTKVDVDVSLSPPSSDSGNIEFISCRRAASLAVSIYSVSWGSQAVVGAGMGVAEQDITLTWFNDDYDEHCPKFLVLVEHAKRRVVLVIRGTFSFKDVLMDVVCEEQAFHGGYAHRGFLEGARKILHKARSHLSRALSENRGYSLLLTGHSMGGATAELILLELLLGPSIPILSEVEMECVSLGPPPVFRGDVPPDVSERVKIFINDKDVVPRLSLGSVAKLLGTLRNLDNLGLRMEQQLAILGWGQQSEEVELQRELVVGVVQGSCQERFPYLGHPGSIFTLDTLANPGLVKVRKELRADAMAHTIRVEESMVTDHVHTSYRDTFNKEPL